MNIHDMITQLGSQLIPTLVPIMGTLVGSLLSWMLYHLVGLIKNEKLRQEIQAAVSYAEQRLTGNSVKLDYVRTFVKAKVGSSLSDEQIEHMIEDAVNALQPTNVVQPQ